MVEVIKILFPDHARFRFLNSIRSRWDKLINKHATIAFEYYEGDQIETQHLQKPPIAIEEFFEKDGTLLDIVTSFALR